MMRFCAFVLLVLLLATPQLVADERPAQLAGVYALDTEDLAEQIYRHELTRLEAESPGLPEEESAPMRAYLRRSAGERARRGRLTLVLRTNGSFHIHAAWTRPGAGDAPDTELGTWELEEGQVLLKRTVPEGARGHAPWPRADNVGMVEAAGLRFSEVEIEPEFRATFLFRKLETIDEDWILASPVERTRRVRASLPAPGPDSGFTYDADIVMWMGSVMKVGTLHMHVQSGLLEGRDIWRVEERWDKPATGEWKQTVAQLGTDLELLEQRMEIRRVDTPDPTDFEGTEKRLLERTAQGYHLTVHRDGVEVESREIPTEARPLTTLATLVMLLRGCPDLPLDYEFVGWDDAEFVGPLISIEGVEPLPAPHGGHSERLAWTASSESEGSGWSGGSSVYLDPGDRKPLAFLSGFASGVGGGAMIIATPDAMPLRELLGFTTEVRSAEETAARLAVGTVWWDPDLIGSAIDWSALHAGASALGFEGDTEAYRKALLAKLERRSRSLLFAEKNAIVTAATRRTAEPQSRAEGDAVRVTMPPAAAEYGVLVRQGPAGWQIVALHDCLQEERRALGDDWADPTQPEPVHAGVRLWLWGRVARSPSPRNKALRVLHDMGPPGWSALASVLVERAASRGTDGGRRAHDPHARQYEISVPALLLACERADPKEQRVLLDTLSRRVRPRDPRGDFALRTVGIEQPALDRTADALPVLLRALAAKRPELRLVAAQRLEMYGALAREAAPALETALEDADERVREAARQALDSVRLEEVEIALAVPAYEMSATVYPASGEGDPVALARVQGSDVGRIVVTGAFSPGTYAVFVQASRHAPRLLTDVRVTGPVTRLGPVRLARGARILMRRGSPEAPSLEQVSARVTHQGAPPYVRLGRYDQELNAIIVSGLGAGSFRVVVQPRDPRKGTTAVLDRVVEVAAATDLEMDLTAD